MTARISTANSIKFSTARREEPDQYQADQVGIYAVAAAGYSPKSFADFFDRLAKTQGKSGNTLTDFLGMTSPDEKRLREIRKVLADLPDTCRGAAAPVASDDFGKWQADVIAYSGLSRPESLPGLVAKEDLDPPLRTDIEHIRFSPDGQYALAQDDASIFVLRHNPLTLLFRVDAPDSHGAQFTSDSRRIVFDTRGFRVEEWSVATEQRLSVHEVAIPGGCLQSRLSPDGGILACLSDDFDLSLVNVATSATVFTKPHAFQPANALAAVFRVIEMHNNPNLELAPMAFSPDGRFFLVGLGTKALAFDLSARAVVPLRGDLPYLVRSGFAFLSTDRVIARNILDPDHSAVQEFPSGKVLQHVNIGPQSMQGAAHGNYIILRPMQDALAGLVDLTSQKILVELRKIAAADVYDQDLLTQETAGQIELFNLSSKKTEATVFLPRSTLGRLRTKEISPDLQWLGVSAGMRGGIWNMSSAHERYILPSFDGAYFDSDRVMYPDFPKSGSQARNISRVDLAQNSITPGSPVDAQADIRQFSSYLVVRKALKGALYQNIALEVRDVRDNRLLWTREFKKEAPTMRVDPLNGSMLLDWRASEDAAKDEIKGDARLGAASATIRDSKTAFLFEALDLQTGTNRGRVLVDTGKMSFKIDDGSTAGDWLFVTDNSSRTHVYSFSTGHPQGVVFGTDPDPSASAGLVAVETGPGEITFYSLPGLEKRSVLAFATPAALESFSADGKRFFVLTANQTAYFFDAAALAHPEASAAKTLAAAGHD